MFKFTLAVVIQAKIIVKKKSLKMFNAVFSCGGVVVCHKLFIESAIHATIIHSIKLDSKLVFN